MMQRTQHQRPTSGGAKTGVVLVLAMGALLGCEGENLFRTDQPPKITEFDATPETVVEADSLTFAVEASGPRTLQSIRLVLEGAMSLDQTFPVSERDTDARTEITINVPPDTDTEQLIATAYAIDVAPDTSAPKRLTVSVVDNTPPQVTATVELDETGASETMAVVVNASDGRGVAVVGAILIDELGQTDTLRHVLSPATNTVSHRFVLEIAELDFVEFDVVPFAEDVNGLTATGGTAEVVVPDQKGPKFLSLETRPDSTIPLGDSLQVIVELSDPSGIQEVTFVGLAFRGDASMGTDSIVERFGPKTITFPRPTGPDTLPQETTLNPWLFADDNVTTEDIEVRVTAVDGAGNVSDTTTAMFVGGPSVQITFPPDDFEVGTGATFNVRIEVNDPTGLDSVTLALDLPTGTQVQQVALPARTDTALELVENVTMPDDPAVVQIQAFAWNTVDIRGESRQITVDVVEGAEISDTIPPLVSVTAERLTPPGSEDRMELFDEFQATVSAFDGLGLDRIGLTIVVIHENGQFRIEEDRNFSGSQDLEELTVTYTIDELLDLAGFASGEGKRDALLDQDLRLRVHGFAADVAGNVACAVGDEERRPCDPPGYSPDEFYVAADTLGLEIRVKAVRGRTVLLEEEEGVIADLEVDMQKERLYMSDIRENLVWGLPLRNNQANMTTEELFPIPVGSQPWGLFIGERAEDERMLIVANSGGTNISFVDITGSKSSVEEVDDVRLVTPNAVLWELRVEQDEGGTNRYIVDYFDFSDRPQFLAQDSLRRVVYSTVGTEAAPTTTIRYMVTDPASSASDDDPEVRFLVNERMVSGDNPNAFAIANVDDIDIFAIEGASDSIAFIGHEPGYPTKTIRTDYFIQPANAMEALNDSIRARMTARGEGDEAEMYVGELFRGSWDLEELDWGDTTYVVASEDRGRIAIGEGGTGSFGRIMMWFAVDSTSSDPIFATSGPVEITDLVNNASEQIQGVGLNENGSVGVVRGVEGTFFFSPDLRLFGEVIHGGDGGAGADFHPDHDELSDGGSEDPDGGGFAFAGTAERTVQIVNTFHFYEVSEIPIRDRIIGPMEVGPPLGGESCSGDECVVAKVYAVTSGGGVLVLNIRRSDLERVQ